MFVRAKAPGPAGPQDRIPSVGARIAAGAILALLLTVIFLLPTGCQVPGVSDPSAPPASVVMRFSIMGDSGLGPPEFLTYPSSANVPQLTRNVLDLAALQPAPSVNIMMGDLVMNFANDQGQNLTSQLTQWQALYSSIPGSGALNLVPYIGNHESCVYDLASGNQWPNSFVYPVWRNFIAQNHYDAYGGNGPTPATDAEDLLVEDERYFSYSFTIQGVRFIIVNTDTLATPLNPSTNQPYFGWIPIHWLETELAGAEADPTVAHVFVLGHRCLVAPLWSAGEDEMPVLDSPAYPLATRLAAALRACSKARAYMCGHIHCQDMTRLQNGAGVWQIITGSSGSPLDPKWSPPEGTYFGFRIVNIYSDGRVGLVSYTRPTPAAPQKYYEDAPVAPPAAVPGQQIFLH